jgi:Fe2+ transport system protein B
VDIWLVLPFMLDRIFRKFGVSGRAFIPMIMGFGCAIPAMINTRTLATEKERIKNNSRYSVFSLVAQKLNLLPLLPQR